MVLQLFVSGCVQLNNQFIVLFIYFRCSRKMIPSVLYLNL